jgi:hypothetical protein
MLLVCHGREMVKNNVQGKVGFGLELLFWTEDLKGKIARFLLNGSEQNPF